MSCVDRLVYAWKHLLILSEIALPLAQVSLGMPPDAHVSARWDRAPGLLPGPWRATEASEAVARVATKTRWRYDRLHGCPHRLLDMSQAFADGGQQGQRVCVFGHDFYGLLQ